MIELLETYLIGRKIVSIIYDKDYVTFKFDYSGYSIKLRLNKDVSYNLNGIMNVTNTKISYVKHTKTIKNNSYWNNYVFFTERGNLILHFKGSLDIEPFQLVSRNEFGERILDMEHLKDEALNFRKSLRKL